MKNPHVIWASVAIILIMVTGAISLALNNKDVSIVLTLGALIALPVLTSLGVATYQKVQEVKEGANGDRDRLLIMIKELHDTVTALALQVRPPEPANTTTEVPWKDDNPS